MTQADTIAAPLTAVAETDKPGQVVVLLHGLCGSRMVLWPLQRHLTSAGYQTLNWGYWSFVGRIESHAARLATDLQTLVSDSDVQQIHFVAHSLGSLLVRTVVPALPAEKIGRVVLLAPPSRGSPVATRVRPLLRWFLPIVDQVSDRSDSYVNGLPSSLAGVDVGLLTAARDILVPPEHALLDGLADQQMLNCRHASIIWQRQTGPLVDRFLRAGTFGAAVNGNS